MTINAYDEFIPLMGKLEAIAYKLKGNKYDAEDLLQNTMLRVWESIDQYTPDTEPLKWSVRIMLRINIDDNRRKSRRAEESRLCDESMDVMDSRVGPEEAYLIQEALEAIIDVLDPVWLQQILLSGQGEKDQEIAKIMNVPIGTVSSRMFRTKRIIAKHFEEF